MKSVLKMDSKADSKDNNERKETSHEEKSNIMKPSRAAQLENIRRNLAKRSLDVKFDLDGYEYKPVENIGIGAYGVVCSAIHIKSGDRVAIKKIPSVFEALSIAKRTYREIKILKHFKHDNIISIREILMPKQNVRDFKDIYVVFDLMESDLHRIIYSDQELSEEHIRYFLYQILRGLKYIHSAHVIHRDLKPSNILVNEDCHLRIGDFGMARGVFYTPDEPSYYMTQYVATRWYRAPEILLSMLEYGAALDMWSVGCIFAEMMGRKHLFPGKDYISQVKLIVGVLGTPSEAILKNCHHEILKKIIKGFGQREPLSWSKMFPKASKKSLDLLSKMLVINPADRILVDQALSHRLLNNYHDPSDEPICVPSFNFDFEKTDMDKTQLRSAIMEEIMSFHQPKQPSFSFNVFLRPAPKPEEPKLAKMDKVSESAKLTGDIELFEKDVDNTAAGKAASESKPHSKVSPVSVDIGKLQVIPPGDIEMLSAQSSDGRQMETQHTDVLSMKSEDKDNRESVEDKRISGDKSIKHSTERKGGNTISEDTRALVKQALLTANQRRQRAESQGEDPKDAKPVTAAQRQREREEKRRKKKERALEKVKKSKEKKGGHEHSITLSSQDKELLLRWTSMQNPGQSEQVSHSPPHPGPTVSPSHVLNVSTSSNPATASTQSSEVSVHSQQATSSGHFTSTGSSKPRQILSKTAFPASVTLGSLACTTSSQITATGTVVIPTTQLGLPQANFIPVIAVPSSVNPGHLEIKRIFQTTNLAAHIPVTGEPSTLQDSDSVKNLLQPTSLLMRNRPNSKVVIQTAKNALCKDTISDVIQNEHASSAVPACVTFSTDIQSSGSVRDGAITHAETVTPRERNIPKSALTVMSKDDKLSPRSQGNDLLEFLNHHLKDSPVEKDKGTTNRIPVQNLYLEQNQHTAEISQQNKQQQSKTPPPPFSNYSQASGSQEQLNQSSSMPNLLRQNSYSQNVQNKHPEPHQIPPVSTTVCDSRPFSDFPSQNDFPAGFQTSEVGQPVDYPQPNIPSFQPDFVTQNDYQGISQTAPVLNFQTQIPHPDMLFQSSSDFSVQMEQHHQVFENTESYNAFEDFSSSSSRSTTSSSVQLNQNFSQYSQSQQHNFSDESFQASEYIETVSSSHMISQQISTDCHSYPNLPSTAATSAGSGSFTTSLLPGARNILSQGTSHPGHRLTVSCNSLPAMTDSNNELIMLLTKQLSKQHMMDIVPSLALTPRGTGAGYGVGMDVDTMLTDAQDLASMRVEQSPLSSSLLSDWLDISESITPADLEALAQELALPSPMNVSYSDYFTEHK